MKTLILSALFISSIAHAQLGSGGPHGGIAAARAGGFSHGVASNGSFGSAARGTAAAGQSGQGGQYGWINLDSSLVDQYQPWPESEMRQFQKAHWEPYTGG